MGGNIPGGNFPGGDFPGGSLMDWSFPGGNFPTTLKVKWKLLLYRQSMEESLKCPSQNIFL